MDRPRAGPIPANEMRFRPQRLLRRRGRRSSRALGRGERFTLLRGVGRGLHRLARRDSPPGLFSPGLGAVVSEGEGKRRGFMLGLALLIPLGDHGGPPSRNRPHVARQRRNLRKPRKGARSVRDGGHLRRYSRIRIDPAGGERIGAGQVHAAGHRRRRGERKRKASPAPQPSGPHPIHRTPMLAISVQLRSYAIMDLNERAHGASGADRRGRGTE